MIPSKEDLKKVIDYLHEQYLECEDQTGLGFSYEDMESWICSEDFEAWAENEGVAYSEIAPNDIFEYMLKEWRV